MNLKLFDLTTFLYLEVPDLNRELKNLSPINIMPVSAQKSCEASIHVESINIEDNIIDHSISGFDTPDCGNQSIRSENHIL